jgi:nucleoside permease NupC
LGPKKKKVFVQVAFSALLMEVLATLMSASVAGMVLMDEGSIAPSG